MQTPSNANTVTQVSGKEENKTGEKRNELYTYLVCNHYNHTPLDFWDFMEIIFDRDFGCCPLAIIQMVFGEDRKMNPFMILVFILAVILGAVMIVGVIVMVTDVTKQISQINVADMVREQIVCSIRGMLGMGCD